MHLAVGRKKGPPSPVVDNVNGSVNIANLWFNSFKRLYNSIDNSVTTELPENLESVLTSADIAPIFESLETIQEAFGKLKHGKVGGASLASDHILNAPASLHHFLVRLFTSLPLHLLSVKFLSGLFLLPGVNTSSPVIYKLASNRASLPPCVLVP